ncbi:MAG: ATP-binding cassette domain-containing protein, partial [Jatrophihabitantaceae bacterium]
MSSPGVAPALELRGITKRFGDLVANDGISLSVQPGEVHAIVGENGAGKTTLMNICFGILQPDDGQILVDGAPVRMSSPIAARSHGIGMVHQHFKLVESLTVAENVFLGAEETHGVYTLDRARMVRELAEVSNRFGLEVEPAQRVELLSAGQRQRVEILKALYFDAKIVILDEPTAVLTPQESDKLFDVLRGLAQAGRSIILITHKLREVLAVADRYTVIRLGRHVAEGDTAGATEEEIATLMVGREVRFGRTEPVPASRPATAPILTCADLVVEDADGHVKVDGVSLDLRPGE